MNTDMDAARDAEQDALAVLGTALGKDYDGMAAILAGCQPLMMLAALCQQVFELLDAQGTSRREWVAEQQERLRRELG